VVWTGLVWLRTGRTVEQNARKVPSGCTTGGLSSGAQLHRVSGSNFRSCNSGHHAPAGWDAILSNVHSNDLQESLSWRWRQQHLLLKRRLISARLHGVTPYKTLLFRDLCSDHRAPKLYLRSVPSHTRNLKRGWFSRSKEVGAWT
jgi:hypothetical protein